MSDIIPRKIAIDGGRSTAQSPMPPLRIVMDRAANAAPIWKDKRSRNIWLSTAFEGMGQYWIDEYLPMRFVRAYATTKLRYRIGGRIPFHESGNLMKMALSGAHATGRMSKGNPYVTIRIPTPGYASLNRQVSQGLRIIPTTELMRLAPVLQRELILSAQGAQISIAKRGVTAGQARATFKPGAGTAVNIAARAERTAQLNKQLGIRGRGRRQQTLRNL